MIQDELDKVADHLEKVGWIQDAGFQDPANYSTSPCCLMGAIEVVSETYVEGQKKSSMRSIGVLAGISPFFDGMIGLPKLLRTW